MATTAEDEVEAPEAGDGPRLGFVGAGMMATAMVNGIVASKVIGLLTSSFPTLLSLLLFLEYIRKSTKRLP